MADDSDFLSNLFSGGMPAGLLSDQDKKGAAVQGLLGLSAGLLRAGGTPSPVKGGSWGRGLGEGVQGLLSGYNEGVNNAMKRQLVSGQLTGQQMQIMEQIAKLQALGLPVPPQMQAIADRMMGGGASGAPAASPAQLAPAVSSGAPGGAPNAPGSSASPAGAGSPGTPTGTAAPAVPNGTDATKGVPSVSGRTLSVAQMAAALGMDPKSVILDPKGVMDKYAEIQAKNATKTDAQKNAEAAGKANPLEYDEAQKSQDEDRKMASALYGQATAGQTLRNLAARTQLMLQNSNMVTAPGYDLKDLANRFKVLIGKDPGAMAPTEQVKMMAAQEMLNTMRETASQYESAGEKQPRWFQSMVETLQNTLANPESMSLATLQNSMERMKREGNRDYEIGGEMLKFREANGGKLGDAWRKRNLELRDPDVFNEDERKALAGLAAPPEGSGIADTRPAGSVPPPAAPPPPAAGVKLAPHPSIGDTVPFGGKTARYKGGPVNDAKSWDVK